MSTAKQRNELHLIDSEGERILRALLPRHWVLREYRPDYGLDFSLETFRPPVNGSKRFPTYETLGEHLFIQLKSVSSTTSLPLELFRRGNVEKQAEQLVKRDPPDVISTIRFSLETSELVTVERMGVGVPVLLVIADISTSKCYFVCLNDYIDKILIPKHGDYSNRASRTIHVPIFNEIGDPVIGQTALRWYAKRPKLYSAFQRFFYQHIELEYAKDRPDALSMARYFASRIEKYDFWDDTEMWGLIGYYGAAVRRFISSGNPGLMTTDPERLLLIAEGDQRVAERIEEDLLKAEVFQLWKFLSVLPRNYEEVCREWFLSTSLGIANSYPSGSISEPNDAK